MKKIVYFNTEDQNDISIEMSMIDKKKYELVLLNGQKESDITKASADADGLVTIYSPITGEDMKKMEKLKVIVFQGIGYNSIDLDAADKEGIAVANVPDFCLQEVATHCVSLALSLSRQIPLLNERVKRGKWVYSDQKLFRLKDKIFGLIAFGNIPRTMVPMLKGFGMRVLVYAPTKPDELLRAYGVERALTLEELLSSSDFVSLHLPLKKQNEKFMGELQFAQMKRNACFINTSSGNIVDEEALLKALRYGVIKGAALDVLVDEKNHNSPLIGFPNVIVTPHMASYSEDSLIEMRRSALKQVLSVLEDNTLPPNLVNKNLIKTR